jgi:hypothetical protein
MFSDATGRVTVTVLTASGRTRPAHLAVVTRGDCSPEKRTSLNQRAGLSTSWRVLSSR